MTSIFKDIRRWLPGVLVSLIFIIVLSQAVDWNSAALAFSTANWLFVGVHALFYFASVGSRAVASRILLEERPTLRDSFLVMMQGYLLNNVLPLRLGELGRAYLLGRKTGTGMFNTLPAVMIERFYDLAFAALILIATLPFVLGDADWAQPVALTTLSVVAVGLLSLHLVARFRTPLKAWIDSLGHRIPLVERLILPRLDAFLDGLAVLTNIRRFALSLFWMMLAWILGAGYMWLMLLAFLPQGTLVQSTFAFGASSFAGAIPSAPSALGVFEGAIVGALSILNVDSGVALAFAVMHHVAHIVYSGIIGFYAFTRDKIGVMELYDQLVNRKDAN
jgi:glycosyltransferase 2 family protein